ncbi:c-type cytochrome [Pedobacter faecalis]|uniref:c-type cytochrome n=1 Tax=Pedobacter faecalis TaxID=3041495 RepID=UPI00254ECE83|nr:c-type cytochrome [Pedobacter sp. ELA7]
MKNQLFFAACLAIGMASCQSPEQRANGGDTAEVKTLDSAKSITTDANTQDADSSGAAPVSGQDEAAPAPVNAATAQAPAPEKPKKDMPGKGLIAKSDCLACHHETKKLVGPAYVNVAKRYPNTDENVNMLAGKIIEGGSGVWGAVPMSPHPDLSKEDAKEMAKYILSLKQ